MNNKRRTDGKLLTLRFDGVIICPEGRARDQFKRDRRTQSAEHKERREEKRGEERRLDLPPK